MTIPNINRAIDILERHYRNYCSIVDTLKTCPDDGWNLSEFEQRRDDAAALLELVKEALAARNMPKWAKEKR